MAPHGTAKHSLRPLEQLSVTCLTSAQKENSMGRQRRSYALGRALAQPSRSQGMGMVCDMQGLAEGKAQLLAGSMLPAAVVALACYRACLYANY